MNGKVVHFEVPATRLKRAQSFYKDVFGWQIMEMPEFNYTMVGTTPSDKNGVPTEVGAINGGMMKKTTRFKCPIITIQVDDIDAALKEVAEHGGKAAVKKTEIGQNMGFTAYFKDTEGNLMGLYQSAR
jgi:predicted enzyme related to lactoylglutathione lyase